MSGPSDKAVETFYDALAEYGDAPDAPRLALGVAYPTIREEVLAEAKALLRGREFAGNRTTGGTSGDTAAAVIERELG